MGLLDLMHHKSMELKLDCRRRRAQDTSKPTLLFFLLGLLIKIVSFHVWVGSKVLHPSPPTFDVCMAEKKSIFLQDF